MNPLSFIDASRLLYAGYGVSDATGMAYFTKNGAPLLRYDPTEVIAFQVKEYSNRYSLDFLLSFPDIWVGMVADDWELEMSRACPRHMPEPTTTGLDAYSDVVFLCKFMGIDGITLFRESDKIDVVEKAMLVNQIEIHWLDFVLDELDSRDLDGEYFVSRCLLDNVARHLIEKGGCAEFDSSESGVRRYVDSL